MNGATETSGHMQSFADSLSAELQARGVLLKVAAAFEQRDIRFEDLEGISDINLRDLCDELKFDVVERIKFSKCVKDALAATAAQTLTQELADDDDFVHVSWAVDSRPEAPAEGAKPQDAAQASDCQPKSKPKPKAKPKPKPKASATATPKAKVTTSPKAKPKPTPEAKPHSKPAPAKDATSKPASQPPSTAAPKPPAKPPAKTGRLPPAGDVARPVPTPPKQTLEERICARFDERHGIPLAQFAVFLKLRMTQATYDRMWSQVDEKQRGFLPRPSLLHLLVFAYMICYAYHNSTESMSERGPSLRAALREDLKPVRDWIIAHELRARPTFRKKDFEQVGSWMARLTKRA